jgi:hypothetical protein
MRDTMIQPVYARRLHDVSPQLHHVPDIYELFAALDDIAAPAEATLIGEGR